MAKYRKKPVMIEAEQWNGKCPHGGTVEPYEYENDFPGAPCKHCTKRMDRHGWIKTLEGGHIVCPNDWIITGVKGERLKSALHAMLTFYGMNETPGEASEVLHNTARAAIAEAEEQT